MWRDNICGTLWHVLARIVADDNIIMLSKNLIPAIVYALGRQYVLRVPALIVAGYHT